MSCWPGGGYGSTCSSAMPSSLSNGAAAWVCAITRRGECTTPLHKADNAPSQKLESSRRKDGNFAAIKRGWLSCSALCSHGIRVLQGHIVRPGCQVMIPHTHTDCQHRTPLVRHHVLISDLLLQAHCLAVLFWQWRTCVFGGGGGECVPQA